MLQNPQITVIEQLKALLKVIRSRILFFLSVPSLFYENVR